jgi:hypothetical protein
MIFPGYILDEVGSSADFAPILILDDLGRAPQAQYNKPWD